LRGNSSNSPTDASSSSGQPPRASSQSQTRKKDNKKRGLAKANKQINIFHEGGVLKVSFQGDASEALQVSHDGGVLKAHAVNDAVFTSQEQEMFFQNEQVQPQMSIF